MSGLASIGLLDISDISLLSMVILPFAAPEKGRQNRLDPVLARHN
jgi:hypothetical protein